MRKLLIITCLAMTSPATAQIEPPASLLERLEQLTKPLIPMLRDLGEQIEKLPNYYPPEVLPNGDIIIRKKPDPEAPESPIEEPLPTEPLEL